MEPVRDPEGIEIEYLSRLESIHERKVLEIGCGNGRLIRRYANFASVVAGVDPDSEQLAEALSTRSESSKTPLFFAQAQAQDLPFSDREFASVILGWSL